MYKGGVPDNRAGEIVQALTHDTRFQFKDQGGYLRYGICPNCGQKELYVRKSMPFRIACGRDNNCGLSWTAKELLPHLFENYEKRFPPTRENPKATAEAYLMADRGFIPSRICGWYDQEAHGLKGSGEWVPTVRFYLDAERTRYWERLIGKTKADGQKAHVGGKRKADGSIFRGDAWVPPGQTLKQGEKCFITEGIFHSIALEHTGRKVAAAISSSNFPSNFIKAHKGRGIVWVLALDGDKAGRKYMTKHHRQLKAMDEHVEVCLLSDGKKDWDDLWQARKLTDEFIETCIYQGALFTAASVGGKVRLLYKASPQLTYHLVEFKNALYSVSIDNKLDEDLKEKDVDVHSEEGIEVFSNHTTVSRISKMVPHLLYVTKDEVVNEQKYVFQVKYRDGTPEHLMELEGTCLSSKLSFHNALLNNTVGGGFLGETRDFSVLSKRLLDRKLLEIKALSFVGYDVDLKTWVFQKHAYHKGQEIKLNEHGYFETQGGSMKTNLTSPSYHTGGEFSPDWFNDYKQAFHWPGVTLLAFWLGSLFAQQIRAVHKSLPFLEVTGDPGAGKSTDLEFVWKLVGRDDEEGFDFLKSTRAGRRRAFNQVSNLPVVLIESDRDDPDMDKKAKQANFDEFKPFFNGRATGTLGVAKRGNDTDEQLFKGTIIFSQNATVDGSKALLERIVHCHVDKKHHGPGTREIARWFERQDTSTVGGFLTVALKNETRILDTYFKAFDQLESVFQKSGIKNERLIKNHAQVAAFGHALSVLFPDVTQDVKNQLTGYLIERAKDREGRLASDHPMVEKFWDAFYFMEAERKAAEIFSMNMSKDPTLVAINLNDFRAECLCRGQELMDITQLKKLLPTSRRHKFVESNRAVWNGDKRKTLKCWVFEA